MAKYFGSRSRVSRDEMRIMLILFGVTMPMVFGGIAVFVLLYTNESQAKAPAYPGIEANSHEQMISVVIPVRDIDRDTTLYPTQFRVESRLRSSFGVGFVHSLEELRSRYSRTLLIKGHPLHTDFMTDTKPAPHIRAQIPKDARAVTISVNKQSGVAGWAGPGSRVDVVWITRVNGSKGLIPIVHDAEILAAGGTMKGDNKKGANLASTVTLLVSKNDVNKVQLAQSSGSISLNLRGDEGGGGPGDISTIRLIDLLPSLPGVPQTEGCRGTLQIADETWCMKENGKLVPLQDIPGSEEEAAA